MSSLYRKYRPKFFNQVVGHEHIIAVLQSSILHKAINHAYLFCGTRGSGKTTLARIFSKTINCENLKSAISENQIKNIADIEPCNNCTQCTSESYDIQEIDAASNRGIDEIRQVQEATRVASFGGGYKVFIIDESHMLSPQACNALLKTLEEPPEHVIFILATTEAHKVLPTILSRVQRFDFKPLHTETIIKKLNSISEQENIKIDSSSLQLIAKAGRGSLRDAETIFERLIMLTNGNLDAKNIAEELGVITTQELEDFIFKIRDLNTKASLSWINQKSSDGAKFEHIINQLIEHLREKYIINDSKEISQRQAIYLIKLFTRASTEQPSAIVASLPLEIVVLEAISTLSQATKNAPHTQTTTPNQKSV